MFRERRTHSMALLLLWLLGKAATGVQQIEVIRDKIMTAEQFSFNTKVNVSTLEVVTLTSFNISRWDDEPEIVWRGESFSQTFNYSDDLLMLPPKPTVIWSNLEGLKDWRLDTCSLNPCFNNATCTSTTEGDVTYTCGCLKGLTGHLCEKRVECSRCDVNAFCTRKGKCICKTGYTGDGIYCTAFCPKATFSTIESDCEFNFPSLNFDLSWEFVSQFTTEECDGGRSAASIDCRTKNEYGVDVTKYDVSTMSCEPCDVTLEQYLYNNTTSEENITVQKIEHIVNALKILTTGEKSTDEMKGTSELVAKMAKVLNNNAAKRIKAKTLRELMLVVQNTDKELSDDRLSEITKTNIDPDFEESTRNREIRKSTSSLMRYVRDFAHAVDLEEERELSVFTLNMTTKIVQTQNLNKSYNAIVTEPRAYVKKTSRDGAPAAPAMQRIVKVNLPPEVVGELELQASRPHPLRLVFVVHQDASILTSDERTRQVLDITFRPGENDLPFSLRTGFQMQFYHRPEPKKEQIDAIENTRLIIHKEYFCVFWDFVRKEWSTWGCRIQVGGPPATCECTHLTPFAYLLGVELWNVEYPLSLFNRITAGTSVIFLIVTIVIHLLVKELRTRRPTTILVNICTSIICGFIFFAIGMDGRKTKFSDAGCHAFAVLMHIAFLSSWFWTLVYSLNLANDVLKVINPNLFIRKKMFMYSVGYAIPILIAVGTLVPSLVMDLQPATLDDDSFKPHYVDTHICWLHDLPLYLGFVAPAGTILLANSIVFIGIIKKLKAKTIRSSKDAATKKQQLLAAVTMSTMMSLTWAFGFAMLAWTDDIFRLTFSIIFDLFTSLQGASIFLVSCVRQKNVRKLWITPIAGFCGSRKSASASGGGGNDMGGVVTASANTTDRQGTRL